MKQIRYTTAVVVVCLVSPALAQVTLDADFDHGSLDVAASTVVGDFVSLVGRDNFNPGDWKWLYFSAEGTLGKSLAFQISDDFATGGSNLVGHEMMYSYNQTDWYFFDQNVRNSGAGAYAFLNDEPFVEDKVYVAYGLPYPLQRATDHTQALAESPWVSPTVSGGDDFVVGNSPGGIDDLGRTISPNDLYGYRITDPSAGSEKTKVVLVGGVHANETLGNYTLEALVDFLVSDDVRAGRLRRAAEFYVYPMANPDGRFAGYNRSTVQQPNVDPNRSWDPPLYDGQSDIRAVAEAILADTAGATDYFIDFHSTVDAGDRHFAYIDVDRGMHLDPVWQEFLKLEPTTDTFDAALVNDTGAKFGFFELGASFSATFETRFIAGENVDRFVELGENFGTSFFEALAHQFGDLDFDGDLDADDWMLLAAFAEGELESLPPIDRYAAGDLNGDGYNDALDFGLFKDAFELANGGGSFALLLASVPEPTSVAGAAVGALVAMTHLRSSRSRNLQR